MPVLVSFLAFQLKCNQGAQASCESMASIGSCNKILPVLGIICTQMLQLKYRLYLPLAGFAVHTDYLVHAVDFVSGGALTRVFHVNTPGGDWRGRRMRTPSQRRRRLRDSEEGESSFTPRLVR